MDICSAAKRGNFERVRELLEDGEDPNKEVWWMTSLHWAASRGHLRILKLILDYGGNINQETRWKYTPLMKATGNGRADCVAYLLYKGAEKDIMNTERKTAWDMAEKKPKILKLFKEHEESVPEFYKKYKQRFEEFEIMSDSEDEDEVEESTKHVLDSPLVDIEKEDVKKETKKPEGKKENKEIKKPVNKNVRNLITGKKKKDSPAPKSLSDIMSPQQHIRSRIADSSVSKRLFSPEKKKKKKKNKGKAKKKITSKKKVKKRKIVINDDESSSSESDTESESESESSSEEEVEEKSEKKVKEEEEEEDDPPGSDIFDLGPSQGKPLSPFVVQMGKLKDYTSSDLPQSPVVLSPTKKQKNSFSALGDCVHFVFHADNEKKKKNASTQSSSISIYTCMAIRSPYLLSKLKKGEMRLEMESKYTQAVENIKKWVYGVQPSFLIDQVPEKKSSSVDGRVDTRLVKNYINVQDIFHTYSLALKWELPQLRYFICNTSIFEISRSSFVLNPNTPTFVDLSRAYFTKRDELSNLLRLLSLSDERSSLYLQCINLVKKYVTFDRIFLDPKVMKYLSSIEVVNKKPILVTLMKLMDPRKNNSGMIKLKNHVEFHGVDVDDGTKNAKKDETIARKKFHQHLSKLFRDHQGTSNLKIITVQPTQENGEKDGKGKKNKSKNKGKKANGEGTEESPGKKKKKKKDENDEEDEDGFEESRKVFDVHREILSLRSRYFRRKLKKKKTDLFLRIEASPKIMEIMLKYIYESLTPEDEVDMMNVVEKKKKEKKKKDEEETEGEDEENKKKKEEEEEEKEKVEEEKEKFALTDLYEIRQKAKKYGLEKFEEDMAGIFEKRLKKEKGEDVIFQQFHELQKLRRIVGSLRMKYKEKVRRAKSKISAADPTKGGKGKNKKKEGFEEEVEEVKGDKRMRRRTIYATLPRKLARGFSFTNVNKLKKKKEAEEN